MNNAPTISQTSNRLTSAAFVIALSHLAIEFSNNFLPIVYPLWQAELGLSYQQLGGIALTSSMMGAITQPVFGYLSDRWDPRWIVAVSLGWIGVMMGLVGFQPTYALILLFVGLGAIGSAAYHPAGASLAAEASKHLKGASVSVFSVGGNLGWALSPLLIGGAVLAWGLGSTAVLIPIGLLLALFYFYYLRSFPLARNAVDAPRQRKVVRGPWLALLLVITAVAARSWVQGALTNFMPTWLQSNGSSPEAAARMLSLLALSVSVGSLSGGTLSDKHGRAPILILSFSLMFPLLNLFFLVPPGGILQTITLIGIGISIGASFPIGILMGQEAWPQAMGIAASLVIGLGWVPAGLGALVIGYIADQTNLTLALSTITLVPLIGVAAGLFFYRRYGG
jgi:MFS transporter, FSR family, fosmidomycin resistance protein